MSTKKYLEKYHTRPGILLVLSKNNTVTVLIYFNVEILEAT